MASRGKLTGKTLPVLEHSTSGSADYSDSPKSLTPPESLGSHDENHESSAEPVPVPAGLRNAFEAATNGQSPSSTVSSNSDGDLFPEQITLYVQDPIVQQLLHHYDKAVASVMPWVDGPQNLWRTVLIPLGMESPSLLLAILALAAEHYTSKMGSTWSKQHGIRSSDYRDRSLKLLAQNLRCEMTGGATTPHQGPPSAMLATILILCNLEMIRSDSSVWSVHWKAARTITRRWTAPHHSASPIDPTCQLLIREAFTYDVFASTTTFDGEDLIPGSVLDDHDERAFTEWMRVIQDVTMSERYRHKTRKRDSPNRADMDMTTLQRRFEYARQRSLVLEKTMDFGSPELHHDFGILIDIFHYAGLIYSLGALLDAASIGDLLQRLVQSTIQCINQIEARSAFQHDFVWPLFIVGTASRDSVELQDFVESRLLEAMTSTGFSNCYPALQFLQRFWGLPQSSTRLDWLQFARRESARGLTFLVI